jgi:hypothetical protein
MATQTKSRVSGVEEVKEGYVKHERNFLIFKVYWWEKVSVEHIGNDIMIETDTKIRNIYFNGVIIK